MNKKIYFNNKFIRFTNSIPQTSQNQSIRFYTSLNEKTTGELIDELLSENNSLQGKNNGEIVTLPSNFEQVLDFLKNKFYLIEAAGGLIQQEKKFLFIFRLGKWDLPKGKIDKGESTEQAAIRECEEECAIHNLSIEQPLEPTYHLYKYKNSFAIKRTYWYHMSTTYTGKLKPQTEENIEEVKWFDKDDIKKNVFTNSYLTILDVVSEAMEKKIV